MANPFATRFVAPAANRFVFSDGCTATDLIERLRRQQWSGQIIGPHGSGKTTLIETLLPLLVQAGRQPVRFQLRDRQRRIQVPPDQRAAWNSATQLIVDGYEQLSCWSRWRLGWWQRRAGCGLLITSHATQPWPLLYRTVTSLETFADLVAQHVTHVPPSLRPTAEQIRRAYEQCDGNLREALFELYDVFEQARPLGSDPPAVNLKETTAIRSQS